MVTLVERARGALGRARRAIGGAAERARVVASDVIVRRRSNAAAGWWDGEKFPGGWGLDTFDTVDYWTLRQRSGWLFRRNLHARGLIQRLVTNEINTGLALDAAPVESVLGFADGELDEWSEDVEARFRLWGDREDLVDVSGERRFGSLQQSIRFEALVDGDHLVMLEIDERTSLPRVRTVSGDRVRTPQGAPPDARIEHGVELDAVGRHVAYWLSDASSPTGSRRVPARSPTTGRRWAWLVYGTVKRHGAVRGEPLLALVLQSLRELDRYRDAALRKAVLNSVLAMFIEKTQGATGSTRPLSGGALLRSTESVEQSDGSTRDWSIAEQVPGLVLEELQPGEKPVGFDSRGIDVDYGKFEDAILRAIAWANEVPPEVLQLSYSHNYSASQAALQEFSMYLRRARQTFADAVCSPIYHEWLIGEILSGRVPRAEQLAAALRDPSRYAEAGAWTAHTWLGAIKPSTDPLKMAKAYGLMVERGWVTNAEASAMLVGGDWRHRIKVLRRESDLLIHALEPLVEWRAKHGISPADVGDSLEDAMGDALDGVAPGRDPG